MQAFIHFLETHLLPCPYKSLTGIDCPGCGMQRAFIALLKGDLGDSLHFYPALLPILFTFALTAIHLRFKLRNGASYVKYSFMGTALLIVGSYITKMVLA